MLGTAGNASARDADSGLIAVSPSAIAYDAMTAADVSVVAPDGRPREGRKPSFELPMHLTILAARPEVAAVVHTHSPYATAISCVLNEIPVVVAEQAATVGGAIPIAPYAPTGEAAMGEAVLAATEARWAAVVRNHGPVCLGRTLDEAVACAFAVEEAARVFALARLHGQPSLLDAAEVERIASVTGRR